MNTQISSLVTANAFMSTKEIAELTDKRHCNVIRDVRNMLAQIQYANLRSNNFQELKLTNGMTQEILLDKDLTVCLVAGYDANVRFKIIKRWQELENQQAQPQFNLPTTYLDALKCLVAETEAHQETKFKAKQVITQASAALVDTMQKLNAATVELSETRPKAQAFDDVLDKGDNVLISEAAKVLGVKQPDLFSWMSRNGWIFRRSLKRPWQAYADKIHNNLLEHRYTNGTDSDWRDHTKCQVTVTPAGIVVLRGLLHDT